MDLYNQTEDILMERLQFIVAGSKGDQYTVIFSREGDNLTASCSCRAGTMGQYCKHRFQLMNGETENLSSSNSDDLNKLGNMLPGTDVEQALYAVEIAEKDHLETKKHLVNCKKALAKSMRD